MEGKEKHFIIVICVASVPGGVFAKCPESFEFRPCEDSSEEQIHHLKFDEWELRMVCETDFQADSKGLYLVCMCFSSDLSSLCGLLEVQLPEEHSET